MNGTGAHTRWLEQLVYANVAQPLGAVASGYGVAGCSQEWPNPGRGDGGLEKLTSYSTLRDVPRSVIVQQLPQGTVLAIRDPHDHDARGRGSYRVHACLDTESALHPRQACVLARTLFTDERLPSPARIGSLPRIPVPDPVRPAFASTPLLEYVVAHLLEAYSGDHRPLAIVDADSDAVLDLIEQALWCLPAPFTRNVRFASWQDSFNSSGNVFGSHLPPLHLLGCSSATSLPETIVVASAREPRRHPDTSLAALSSTLVALAEAKIAVDDDLDTHESLVEWTTRPRLSRSPVAERTSSDAVKATCERDLGNTADTYDMGDVGREGSDTPPLWWAREPAEQARIWREHPAQAAGELDRLLSSTSDRADQALHVIGAVAAIDPFAAMAVSSRMYHPRGARTTADHLGQIPRTDVVTALARLWPVIAWRAAIPAEIADMVELSARTTRTSGALPPPASAGNAPTRRSSDNPRWWRRRWWRLLPSVPSNPGGV